MLRKVLPLALLVLAACDKKQEAAPATATSAAVTPARSAAPLIEGKRLAEGDPAPDVKMPLQDGKTLALSSLKGKNVVVYFYPKDETSGCTVEAQNFRDKFEDMKKADIAVIGVSMQDAASTRRSSRRRSSRSTSPSTMGRSRRRSGSPCEGPSMRDGPSSSGRMET